VMGCCARLVPIVRDYRLTHVCRACRARCCGAVRQRWQQQPRQCSVARLRGAQCVRRTHPLWASSCRPKMSDNDDDESQSASQQWLQSEVAQQMPRGEAQNIRRDPAAQRRVIDAAAAASLPGRPQRQRSEYSHAYDIDGQMGRQQLGGRPRSPQSTSQRSQSPRSRSRSESPRSQSQSPVRGDSGWGDSPDDEQPAQLSEAQIVRYQQFETYGHFREIEPRHVRIDATKPIVISD
jgi:hypothetical protein